MKILGFLLLLAGWALSVSAIALLSTIGAKGTFIAAAIGVEVLGLALVIRAHPKAKGVES